MKRIQIKRERKPQRNRWFESGGGPPPLDPRDPDIVRAKALQRRKKPAA